MVATTPLGSRSLPSRCCPLERDDSIAKRKPAPAASPLPPGPAGLRRSPRRLQPQPVTLDPATDPGRKRVEHAALHPYIANRQNRCRQGAPARRHGPFSARSGCGSPGTWSDPIRDAASRKNISIRTHPSKPAKPYHARRQRESRHSIMQKAFGTIETTAEFLVRFAKLHPPTLRSRLWPERRTPNSFGTSRPR